MIFAVAHQNLSIAHDRYALEALEFGWTGSPASESPQERAIGVEDLDPVVARVANKDVSLVVHSHTPETNVTVQNREWLSHKDQDKINYRPSEEERGPPAA